MPCWRVSTSFRPKAESESSGRYVGWLTDHIRRRAYEIYKAREDSPGTVEGDWQQAERELKNHSDFDRNLRRLSTPSDDACCGDKARRSFRARVNPS
jgi:hypothetical protein